MDNSEHNRKHPLKWCEINRRQETTGGEYMFISSTCYDLVDLRYELQATMKDWGLSPILSDVGASYFEHGNTDSISACLQNVDRSDVFVLILSQRYSTGLKNSFQGHSYGLLSATHVELCRALEIRRLFNEGKVKNPLPILVWVRDDLYKAYLNWKNKIGNKRIYDELKTICNPGEEKCCFSPLLEKCESYLNGSKSCQSDFVISCCEHVIKDNNPWLGLLPISNISKKALNRYRLQALAQFFLLHILFREKFNKKHYCTNSKPGQPFYVKTFKTVTDLKEKINPLLLPNMKRAIFLRALTNSQIPALNIEIPNTSLGAPSNLYLILKNASRFPVIWTKLPSISIYRTHAILTDNDENTWEPIGKKIPHINYSFESASSALLPGDSTMARIDMWEREPKYRYLLYISYRTIDDLYITDIFDIKQLEPLPLIQYVKKIPDPEYYNTSKLGE